MKTFAFVLGVFCPAIAFCAVLEADYARACWFLILGLANLHIALER